MILRAGLIREFAKAVHEGFDNVGSLRLTWTSRLGCVPDVTCVLTGELIITLVKQRVYIQGSGLEMVRAPLPPQVWWWQCISCERITHDSMVCTALPYA